MKHRGKESFQREAVFPHLFERERYLLINGTTKQSPFHNSIKLIYSIDTAVVYSFSDTTRYTHTFTTGGKLLIQVIDKRENGNWVKNYRGTYAYDENGREISEVAEQWKNGQWEYFTRYTRTYHANGNRLSFLSEHWINGQWENLTRYTYTYNAEGKILSDLDEHWTNEQWNKFDRLSYSYDDTADVFLYEQWADGQLEFSFRSIYTHDERGKIISVVDQEWLIGQWIHSDRTTYAYDNNGNDISSLLEVWKNEQWENLERRIITYDEHGNITSDLLEQWAARQQWERYTLFTFTYDTNGKQISFLYERWKSGKWENNFRNFSIYDGKGNKLSLLTEQWKNGQWENLLRYTALYDEHNNITFQSGEVWLNGSWGPSFYPLNIADSAGNYFTFIGSAIFLHYKQIVATIVSKDDEAPLSYQLDQNYPNPFNPSTVISYQLPINNHVTLKVYDAIGREVATLVNEVKEAGNYSATFNASKLSSGMYFARLQSGHKVQLKKMLLVK
ncbi:MAG: T9SS type A sorting domain-containing protein [Bacteroidota bacterium]